MAPRLYTWLGIALFAALFALDLALDILNWPLPVRVYNLLLAVAAVLTSVGLHGRTYRQGLELGQLMRGTDRQGPGSVVVPMRHRATSDRGVL